VSRLSRKFLATAAACLFAGVVLGFVMLLRREYGGNWPSPLAISAHTHLILVGAMLEAIIGTALWLFPRPPRGRRQAPAWLGEVAWAGLTVGTVIRAMAELLRSGDGGTIVRIAVVAGAALQVIGVMAGVIVLQPRVRGSVTHGDAR
jgi:hypothetical protein